MDVAKPVTAAVPSQEEPLRQAAAAVPSVTQSYPSDTKPQEISPEILTVIQTAAAVFVAKKMESEKARPDRDSRSWSGQGREIVQGSHNLVQRGVQRGH
jgi:hypothetical protein